MGFWDLLWTTFMIAIYASYLVVLFHIVGDLLTSPTRTGTYKALWLLVLILFPILGGLAYLLAHGQSMTLRQENRAIALKKKAAADNDRTGPVDQIELAHQLMHNGTLTPSEFAAVKARLINPGT